MSARDELVTAIWSVETRDFGGYSQRDAEAVADALIAAGYRLAQPVWEPSLLNDGVYEYTQTSTCDGSTVYNYRRLPRLRYEGGFPSWEIYQPEAAK